MVLSDDDIYEIIKRSCLRLDPNVTIDKHPDYDGTWYAEINSDYVTILVQFTEERLHLYGRNRITGYVIDQKHFKRNPSAVKRLKIFFAKLLSMETGGNE